MIWIEINNLEDFLRAAKYLESQEITKAYSKKSDITEYHHLKEMGQVLIGLDENRTRFAGYYSSDYFNFSQNIENPENKDSLITISKLIPFLDLTTGMWKALDELEKAYENKNRDIR